MGFSVHSQRSQKWADEHMGSIGGNPLFTVSGAIGQVNAPASAAPAGGSPRGENHLRGFASSFLESYGFKGAGRGRGASGE